MDTKLFFPYLAPDVEVMTIAVEQGFTASSNVEDPFEDAEQDW